MSPSHPATQPDFNRIARAYRWLEYLTLGPLLERTRNHHLLQLQSCTHALILGDGDGRFTARLLATNPDIRVNAVDISGTMLYLLRRRCAEVTSLRLRTHHFSALEYAPKSSTDLVVTHFFLDCLSQEEVDTLIVRIAKHIRPGAIWLVSDFRIPTGLLQWPARVYIRALYLAFRILTGLRTTRLPDHAASLRHCGFIPVAVHRSLFGLLTTELWQRPGLR